MIAKNVAFIMNLKRERQLAITLESENHTVKINFISDSRKGCCIEIDSPVIEQCVQIINQDTIHLELVSLSSEHCRLFINKPKNVRLCCTTTVTDIEHDTLVTTTSTAATSSGNDVFEEDSVSVLTHQGKCRTSGCLNYSSKSKKGLCLTCYQAWIDHGLIKDHFDFISSDEESDSGLETKEL